MALLPPTPVGVPPGHSFWNDWYEKLRDLINNNNITVTWGNILFSGSNLTDIVTRNHNDLQNFQGGSANSYYHLTQTQHTDLTDAGDSALHFHATDRDRANHTGTQLMSTISDLPTLAHGTYTPTITNTTNIDSSTPRVFQYLRVGNTVTVSGAVEIDATATAATVAGISIPIASNFNDVTQLSGSGVSSAATGQYGRTNADITNDRAELSYTATSTGAVTMYIHFTYLIV
jgi:hypothetical protein